MVTLCKFAQLDWVFWSDTVPRVASGGPFYPHRVTGMMTCAVPARRVLVIARYAVAGRSQVRGRAVTGLCF